MRGWLQIANLSQMSDPLFSYCLKIADREFLIEVSNEGIIYWDDYQMRRRVRTAADRHLEIESVLGDARARERLSAEIDEFTVAFPLAPESLARFRDAAKLLDEDRWTTHDEEELDKLLIPLFWSRVNPLLGTPVAKDGE